MALFSNLDVYVILFILCDHDEIVKNDSLYLGNPSITFGCGIHI